MREGTEQPFLTELHLFEKCCLNLTCDRPVIKNRPEQGSVSVLEMTVGKCSNLPVFELGTSHPDGNSGFCLMYR